MIIPNPSFAVEGQITIGNSTLDLIIFPAGTKDTASTRLRAWPILEKLASNRERSFEDLFLCSTLYKPVLWFQKKITEQHLQLAREYKKRGAHIIYDCDESGPALSYWAQPHLTFEMFHLADQVIADTPERIQWIKKSGTLAKLSILENQIDYGKPREDFAHNTQLQSKRRMRILWYGNSCNLFALKSVAGLFLNTSDYQLVLCGATADDASMALPDCDPEIHQWDRATFLQLLESCDVCILSHSGTPSDCRKSGHKMITSICHGVPAVASSTPDYMRIARCAGIEDYLFSDVTELDQILKRLMDPEIRRKYISIAKPPLLEKYYQGSFANNATAIIESARQKQIRKPRVYQSMLRGKLGLIGSKSLRLFGKIYWRRMQS